MDDNKHTTQTFNLNAGPAQPAPPRAGYKPVAQPISKQQIDDLHKKLSKPGPALDYTPMGSEANEIKKRQDAETLRKIEEVRRRLASRQDAAKEAFGRNARNNKPRS